MVMVYMAFSVAAKFSSSFASISNSSLNLLFVFYFALDFSFSSNRSIVNMTARWRMVYTSSSHLLVLEYFFNFTPALNRSHLLALNVSRILFVSSRKLLFCSVLAWLLTSKYFVQFFFLVPKLLLYLVLLISFGALSFND